VLAASSPRGELAVAVSRSLKLSGAVIVERGDSGLVLKLGDEQFARRNLSLTAQARAAEVELTLGTEFGLYRGEQVLVDQTPAVITRQMLDDPGNVVGKNEELGLLRGEMRRDIADQIVRRVSYSLDN
jgi:LPS-assembly lipoprotein